MRKNLKQASAQGASDKAREIKKIQSEFKKAFAKKKAEAKKCAVLVKKAKKSKAKVAIKKQIIQAKKACDKAAKIADACEKQLVKTKEELNTIKSIEKKYTALDKALEKFEKQWAKKATAKPRKRRRAKKVAKAASITQAA